LKKIRANHVVYTIALYFVVYTLALVDVVLFHLKEHTDPDKLTSWYSYIKKN